MLPSGQVRVISVHNYGNLLTLVYDNLKFYLRRLFEDEKLHVLDETQTQIKYDYKTNKYFFFKVFVVMYLRAVVAMTHTPSAGKVLRLRYGLLND